MNSPRFSPIDPISRYSEILFGLLMVLTFTGCFNAFEAGRAEVRDLLIAGIGCNIAWGIIDAIVYLITGFVAVAVGASAQQYQRRGLGGLHQRRTLLGRQVQLRAAQSEAQRDHGVA